MITFVRGIAFWRLPGENLEFCQPLYYPDLTSTFDVLLTGCAPLGIGPAIFGFAGEYASRFAFGASYIRVPANRLALGSQIF